MMRLPLVAASATDGSIRSSSTTMTGGSRWCCTAVVKRRMLGLAVLCFVGSVQFYRDALEEMYKSNVFGERSELSSSERSSLDEITAAAVLVASASPSEPQENIEQIETLSFAEDRGDAANEDTKEIKGAAVSEAPSKHVDETLPNKKNFETSATSVTTETAFSKTASMPADEPPSPVKIGEARTAEEKALSKPIKKPETDNSIKLSTPKKPVERIVLIGERHSGTNWITDHLTECFSESIKVIDQYKRWKHGFQEDDLQKVADDSAVVVAMFRDPYDWVEAMRVEPHHSHDHVDWYQEEIDYDRGWREQANAMEWYDFVTKPWIGHRGLMDKNISKDATKIENAKCMDQYSFVDAAPCSMEDSKLVKGLGYYKYEFQHDGSEKGFASIIDLRRAKIMNHLSIADFRGTRAFFPFRFEDLNANGTAVLLQSVEEATGVKAQCNATLGKAPRRLAPKPIIKHRELPGDYIKWMDKFVDWEVESRIGYFPRGEVPSTQDVIAPVKKSEPTKPVEKIVLIGERHSGTNWITDHLTECFDIKVTNQYKRFKHWFQEEDFTSVPENSAVVVAMFRDPYDWVESMRVEPHHAPDHLDWYRPHDPEKGWREMANPLTWKSFVTRPWIGRRNPADEPLERNMTYTKEEIENVQCMDKYSYDEIAPCFLEDSPFVEGLGPYKYEFQHDKSGRGFSSIIDLRRAKIINHLSVADFLGTRAFLPFRFEDLNANGTTSLLQSVEEATGLKAKCNATLGKARRHLLPKKITKHRQLPEDYVEWMTRFVDWEVEGRIGYFKRG